MLILQAEGEKLYLKDQKERIFLKKELNYIVESHPKLPSFKLYRVLLRRVIYKV